MNDPSPYLSLDERRRIARTYHRLRSVAETARLCGRSPATVSSIVQWYGYDSTSINWKDARRVAAELDELGDAEEVAWRSGRSVRDVLATGIRHGVYVNLPSGWRRDALLEEIERFGWTDEEVARENEVTLASARRWRSLLEEEP